MTNEFYGRLVPGFGVLINDRTKTPLYPLTLGEPQKQVYEASEIKSLVHFKVLTLIVGH